MHQEGIALANLTLLTVAASIVYIIFFVILLLRSKIDLPQHILGAIVSVILGIMAGILAVVTLGKGRKR